MGNHDGIAAKLDERGERTKAVPVSSGVGGCAVVSIGPEYRTVWYEIEAK